MSNLVEKIHGIYAITPDKPLNFEQIEKIITQHSISILQYRNKRHAKLQTHQTDDNALKLIEAKKLRQLCIQHHTLFIINDDINLAQKIGADGVHLGKDDNTIQYARQQLGADAIIGLSCYNNIDLAIRAQAQGANYGAFGALFPSSTKPNAPHCTLDTLTQAKKILHIPIVGIGGINFDNQDEALQAGCHSVAMIDALFK